MKTDLIASALPPLDSSSLLFYAAALFGAAKGAAKAYEWASAKLERRRKDRREEVAQATEGARLSREEAVHLTEIQDKTIARLERELQEAEAREREALVSAKEWEAKFQEADAKLSSAGRQWFEREGFIRELERRVKDLEGR